VPLAAIFTTPTNTPAVGRSKEPSRRTSTTAEEVVEGQEETQEALEHNYNFTLMRNRLFNM